MNLEPLRPAHVPQVLATMRDPATLRFTRAPDPVPDGWVEQWLTRFDGHDRHAWAVLDGTGTFVGYAVTGPVDHEGAEVELGYAVAPDARGRGVATAALLAMTRWAFDAGLQRATALVSTENPASARVAAKAGYVLEGVLRSVHHRGGRRVDLQCWSRLPSDPDPTAAGRPGQTPTPHA
ncbi:Protein N-acetyltransferase, RimJ/RimL family [Nocardioides scoriae]|uniref:Protein N-acetyltransferase, RimJ/RimL family n=1 Tax=Nocardioides scoriae TaxID=642780 RepID=A0A1H1N567_9ACTN|nr:Protein N-acetyltransferase, RimJ/RimL family [Nocardioides scoriae]